MGDGPYRDPESGVRQERDELAAARAEELAALPAAAMRVITHRAARIAAGAVGVAAAFALAVATLNGGGASTAVLVGAWPAMFLAWAVTRVAAQVWLTAALAQHVEPTHDVLADLARLARPVLDHLHDLADRLERRSVALPLMALALLAPLTLHFVVATLLGASGNFDTWIVMSLVLVGHAHLVLAWSAWRFAGALRQRSLDELYHPCRDGVRALGATFAWSILPSGLLLFIPPLLVALTGALFVPASFGSMQRRVAAERTALRTA